jgi:hypothetical protein
LAKIHFSLYIVHPFHNVYFAMQTFCLPIERSNVSLLTTDQQMSTISCVVYSIRTKLVQAQIEIFLRREQVDILDYVLLSDALVFVLFFQVTKTQTNEILFTTKKSSKRSRTHPGSSNTISFNADFKLTRRSCFCLCIPGFDAIFFSPN